MRWRRSFTSPSSAPTDVCRETASLSVIILSWNVRDLLAQALTSLYTTAAGVDALEVIVVDNASHDGSAEMVAREFPQTRLIANQENRGFTRGNNQGISEASGNYILLLNPDTELLPGALQALMAYLDKHPDTAMVGPRLLNPDGSTQPSRRRFPTLPILFLESTWLQPLAPKSALARFYMQDRPDTVAQEVDWITGAAMMVRREAVERVGPLDEGYFMYSEELDWCRRFRDAGWRIAYVPTAEIIHYGGKSSEQVVPSRHIYFQSSKVRYARKVHGAPIAEALRVWLLTQYLWQIVLEGAKWSMGHRRTLRAARVSAYWRVIKSGLHLRQEDRR
jgi:N-acetylglucosaminyl-diphospho-decaprenol L-rhamnosyltransferase